MKNIKVKINYLVFIIMFTLLGCENQFVEPKYEPEFPWQTVSQFEMGVIEPYSTFNTQWSEVDAVYAVYETLSTDLGTLIPGQTGNLPFNEFYNRLQRDVPLEAASLKWVSFVYNNLYKTIGGCNVAIAYLESNDYKNLFPKDLPSVVDAELPRAKAELHFWRGFAYYYGALYFCPPYDPSGTNSDRILPLKTIFSNPQNTNVGTTREIWTQAISDLQKAKTLMPKSWYKNGRINYYAICGALARAYVYTGDYANAQKECDEIISSGKYSLQSDVMAAWNTLPGGVVPTETIWHYNPNKGGNQKWNYSAISRADPWGKDGSRGTNYGQCAWVLSTMSNAMIKKIGWMDDPAQGSYSLTDIAKADKRLGKTWFHLLGYKPQAETGITDAVIYKNTYESLNKQLVNPHIYLDKYYRASDNSKSVTPLMRLSEFYLIRSAIKLKNNDKAGAAEDLNTVRTRAGVPAILPANITESNIDAEFAAELGGEGSYLPYLIGMRRPILPGDRAGVQPVNPPYKGWFFRIPIDEVRLNAGYKDIPDPNGLK